MIRTVSGEFQPDSPFLRKSWNWGMDGLEVNQAKNTNTVVVSRDESPIVNYKNLGFTYLGPTS